MRSTRGRGCYATLHTNLGPSGWSCSRTTPRRRSQNFVELAEGTEEYTDPRTGQPGSGPYYDGTIFHRVIAGFMIQGGDPTGTGRGGPGYKFNDEIHPELRFNRPYLLAMANAGPGHQRLAVLHHGRPDAAPQQQAHHLR